MNPTIPALRMHSCLLRRFSPSAVLARSAQVTSCRQSIYQTNNLTTSHRQFTTSPTLPWSRSNSHNDSQDSLPYYSPHQPKRQWPPDISKLSQKHQFRLERKYRRRAALKWERPRWKKWTKIVQYGLYAYIISYALFYLDWGEGHVINELRDYFFSSVKSIFSPPPPPGAFRKLAGEAKE